MNHLLGASNSEEGECGGDCAPSSSPGDILRVHAMVASVLHRSGIRECMYPDQPQAVEPLVGALREIMDDDDSNVPLFIPNLSPDGTMRYCVSASTSGLVVDRRCCHLYFIHM